MRDNAVNTLAGIFFQVRTREVDGLDVGFPVFRLYRKGELAALDDRQIKLTDLIALWQIRVEVVFTVKNRFFSNFRTDCQTKADRLVNGADIENRQGPGQRQINVAGLRVGFGTESTGGTGENF